MRFPEPPSLCPWWYPYVLTTGVCVVLLHYRSGYRVSYELKLGMGGVSMWSFYSCGMVFQGVDTLRGVYMLTLFVGWLYALVMHIGSLQLSEIGLSALKLKYWYWFFFQQMFQNNVKRDDILVVKYLLFQS